jgi:hypothetical protein
VRYVNFRVAIAGKRAAYLWISRSPPF